MDGNSAVLGSGSLSADKLLQANINPGTGLATDYLNHFNEVVMLMEMLPDMPDCSEDVLEWCPADYETHFENSSFSEKELAIQAYYAAPVQLREHLESWVSQINTAVGEAQKTIQAADDPATIADKVADMATNEIKPLISRASGVIHGHIEADAIEQEGDQAQAEIDAMFS